MTDLQLKLAVAISSSNSISNAAKLLNISQSNASSYIKALENEIGFVIFNRTKNGVTVTEKGQLLLEHAKRIVADHESIMNIRNAADNYRLRLGAVNYLSAAEPFLKLCRMHRDDPGTDFRFFNVSVKEGLEQLEKFSLDLVFSPVMKSQLTGLRRACEKMNIAMISLGEIPAVISVRKDHPAIAKGQCKNITQGSDAMKEYPYVAYRNLSEDGGSTGYNDTDFVRSSSVMYVDEVTVRLRLVASTNAFCFGITPSNGVNERYGLVSFPVPGISLEIFCLVRQTDINRKEIGDYITLLKEELGIA